MTGLLAFVALVTSLLSGGEPAPEAPGHYCPCLREPQVRALVSLYADWDDDAMLRLARAEASLGRGSERIYYFGAVNVNAGGSVDRCGFQINSVHGFDGEALLASPIACVAAAHDVWRRQGYEAWATW